MRIFFVLPAKIMREIELFFCKDLKLLVFWGETSCAVFHVLADDTLVWGAYSHSRDI